jgi:lantibiotic modifying enzyme
METLFSLMILIGGLLTMLKLLSLLSIRRKLSQISKLIAWEFPSIGRFKFNTDGASKRKEEARLAWCCHGTFYILVSRVLVAFSKTVQEHGSVGIPEK